MAIRQLAGQTMWYGLSNIVGRLIGSLLSPLLTHLLGDDASGMMDMGNYSIIYAWIAVANIVFTYGLETGYFRFINKEGVSADSLFNTAFGSLLISTVLYCALIIGFRQPIGDFLTMGGHPEFISYIAVIIGLDTLATIPFARLRSEGRPKKYAFIKISGIVINILCILLFLYVIPVWLKDSDFFLFRWINGQHNVGLILLANLLQNIVVFLLLFREWKGFSFRIDWTLWRNIVNYSAPMIVIGLAGMVNEVLDRQFLSYLLPLPPDKAKAMVGIYAANYKLAIFISLFIQAFRLGAEPFFFRQAAEKDAPKTYALVMKWFVITLCLAFLVAALYLDVVVLVNKERYRVGMGIVPIVLMANVFLGIYYNLSVWYKITDRMRWGIFITIIGAIITLVLNYVLIPGWGIFGSAWATFACYFIMMLLAYFIGQRYYPVPYDVQRILVYIILAVVLFGTQQILKYYLSDISNYIHPLVFSMVSGTLFLLLFIWFVIRTERLSLRSMLSRAPLLNKMFR